jgi:hypothetical protein
MQYLENARAVILQADIISSLALFLQCSEEEYFSWVLLLVELAKYGESH